MKTRTDEPPFPQHEAGYCECLPGGEVLSGAFRSPAPFLLSTALV